MLITGHRIRKLPKHLQGITPGRPVVIGLADPTRLSDRLAAAGLPKNLDPGLRLLPSRVGPVSTFNAEGKWIVHKDRPKEWRVVGQREWRWTEFRGRYDREEMVRIVDIERECYPRTFVPPPSIEIGVALRPDGALLLISDPITHDAKNADKMLHVVNLYLELFGEALVLTQDLEGFIVSEVRRLNWMILPAGKLPWDQLNKHVAPFIEKAPEGTWPVLRHRLSVVNSYGPEFTATGHGGFAGYIVFGFPAKDVYVLESLYYGNATYVFDGNWETLSQMTKAEILKEDRAISRIIHREGWERQIAQLLT